MYMEMSQTILKLQFKEALRNPRCDVLSLLRFRWAILICRVFLDLSPLLMADLRKAGVIDDTLQDTLDVSIPYFTNIVHNQRIVIIMITE